MQTNVLFYEKQYFRQWWVWLIPVGINGIFIWGFTQQVILGKTFGDNPMSNAGLIITGLIVFFASLSIFIIRLETKITTEGIYVRFFPFHFKWIFINWQQINKTTVVTYQPLKEYGGWGLRYGAKGKAYSVSGNKGLKLEFTDGTSLLIGTKKEDEINKILFELKK